MNVKEGNLEETLDYSHHNANTPAGATVSDEADNSRAKVCLKLNIVHVYNIERM